MKGLGIFFTIVTLFTMVSCSAPDPGSEIYDGDTPTQEERTGADNGARDDARQRAREKESDEDVVIDSSQAQ